VRDGDIKRENGKGRDFFEDVNSVEMAILKSKLKKSVVRMWIHLA
jgi:hypothetical protein